MLASGARLTALKSCLSTEREQFWHSLTAPKLDLVGFAAEYKGAILSSNHWISSFSAEVNRGSLQRPGTASWKGLKPCHERILGYCWECGSWTVKQSKRLARKTLCLPQSMQKQTFQLFSRIPHGLSSGFRRGEWIGGRRKGWSCLCFSFASWHLCFHSE